MTFSLLLRDAATGQLGIASQSHYLGVGAVVTWAQAGVGVVATQAFAVRSHGPRGLALLERGLSPQAALEQLLADDPDPAVRQVAIVGADGALAVHDGARCVPAAAVARAEGAVALGNMLAGEEVVAELLAGALAASGGLAQRLVAGLAAADRAGGDIRGRQSASLLVVDGARGPEPWDGVLRDLRVEDHPDPIGELGRLVELSDAVDRMSAIVFDPDGPILGRRGAHSDAQMAQAAAALAETDGALGDNPEARYWSAVLHARWGRWEEARRLLRAATAGNERLPRFFERMTAAGILEPAEVERVLR
jgi:uncharacterized Ntn-hydrolase superfamily protein